MRARSLIAASGAALLFSTYCSVGAAASPASPRYDAQRGGMLLRSGKVIPLSGIYTYAGPGRATSKSAKGRPNAQTVGGAGVTLVNASVRGPFPANEPAIGADPTDPKHVIASANDYRFGDSAAGLYSSFDDGASFTDTIVQYVTSAPYYFQAAGDPAVGIDRRGIGYFGMLAFNRTTSGSAVIVGRSTPADDGRFVDAVPAAANLQGPSSDLFDDKDALGVDDVISSPFAGSVYSTFTQFGPTDSPIVESRSRNQASSFSAAVPVSHASPLCAGGLCADDQGSSIAVGPHGIVYVAYENYDVAEHYNQILISRSSNGGVSFGPPVRVAYDYDIANPHGTFRVNSFPNLAANPATGALYVVWADERAGVPAIYISSSTSGTRWSTPRAVAAPKFGGFQFFPAVGVQSSTGNVYVSFYDNVEHPGVDAYDYFYRRLTPDLRPETPETQASRVVITPGLDFGGGFFGDYTSLATTREGAHLIWTGTSTGQQDIETRLVR